MKNRNILVIVSIIVLIGIVFYFLLQDNIKYHGRLYSSKQIMCEEFAQSYLRTIQKTDNASSSGNTSSPENQRWGMAIDVETELYNLCLLNLNKETLKNYKLKVFEKYQK